MVSLLDHWLTLEKIESKPQTTHNEQTYKQPYYMPQQGLLTKNTNLKSAADKASHKHLC
jgi:hypothetical protein